MNGQSTYGMQWIQRGADGFKSSPRRLMLEDPQQESFLTNGAEEYLVNGEADDIDQIAAENLIFMARDGQMVTEIISSGADNGTVVVSASDGTPIDCAAVMQQIASGMLTGPRGSIHDDNDEEGNYVEDYSDSTPQMVTEEVITDDWVQHQGEERVEIPAEQIIGSSSQVLLDMEVPLPTVQDEYLALRPYPCDFCSRRFRKKASLLNHMIAHQTDRSHLCKLCGSRFLRRSELINHLKAHADAPDPEYESTAPDLVNYHQEHDDNIHMHERLETVDSQDYDSSAWDAESMADAARTSRKQTVQNNDYFTSTAMRISPPVTSVNTANTTTGRGRISRLKPRDDSYSIQQSFLQHVGGNSPHSVTNSLKPKAESEPTNKKALDITPGKPLYPIIDPSKPFVCQQCGLAFAREKALLSHVKNHRNDPPFECSQCGDVFWDMSGLQEHQRTHQFEDSNSEYEPEAELDDSPSESETEHLYGDFYCSECGMSFHRQDLLRRHATSHRKSATASGDSAPTDGDLNINNQHCCNTCGETFAEALDLLAHAEMHARFPPFKCLLCGETFFEEQTIKQHLQSVHPHDMTPNSCILCGKECRDRRALIKHAWDHSREKCHSCSKCGKNFHNKARLKRHMASHRDKTVTCDVCQEEFPDGRTLSNHRHSHSATSAGKLFPCHECGKTFGSRSSQQIHVRIHTGERPYGCRYCWKAFADGGTLRKHERIHTGEKPYVCSVCPRAFNQRVVLREHIRSHHSRIDAKRGTFFCSACSAELPSSAELLQHLIQHSDRITAMQRQPVVSF